MVRAQRVIGALLPVLAGCLSEIDLTLMDVGPYEGMDGGGRDAWAPPMDGCLFGMVPAGGRLCIDATEVTRQLYEVFLRELGSGPPAQQLACRANEQFQPAFAWPPSEDQRALPVVGVDWCDAVAFCTHFGRHLCTEAEWSTACSQNGARAYPYGSTHVAQRCNGDQLASGPLGAGAKPGCEGGYPKLFDMSGNVAEWVDQCSQGKGNPGDSCVALGGSFANSGAELSCGAAMGERRLNASGVIGFRCCRSR